jgi:hypothetical protein
MRIGMFDDIMIMFTMFFKAEAVLLLWACWDEGKMFKCERADCVHGTVFSK